MDISLKKLNRAQLLQLLAQTSEDKDALIAENAELREELRHRLPLSKTANRVGSIAEAALEVNGFFESAQHAANDYLREIKRLRDQAAAQQQAGGAPSASSTRDAQKAANAIIARAKAQAQAILVDAREEANRIVDDANAQANAIVERANRHADAYVESARSRAGARSSAASSGAGASRRGQHSKQRMGGGGR